MWFRGQCRLAFLGSRPQFVFKIFALAFTLLNGLDERAGLGSDVRGLGHAVFDGSAQLELELVGIAVYSGGVDGGPERVQGVVGVVQQSIQVRDDGVGSFNNGVFGPYGRNLQVRERWWTGSVDEWVSE